MLTVNRIRIEIKTENGVYGFDESFKLGLNFISSDDNTCGKSSIIVAIYYCLGFEEIIGGKGEKVLTSVYKNSLEDGQTSLSVLESEAYLEISNGQEVITLYRGAKVENRDSRLITVYFSPLNDIGSQSVIIEDYYVHMPNSAKNEKGFHNFLENFLNLQLPLVPASDDSLRKLYLQLIFSSMFIEQKHGWSDIFSGMPILGIKESKKRVVEYILNLDTLNNEKERDRLKLLERELSNKWINLVKACLSRGESEFCSINNLPLNPKLIDENDLSRISISKNGELLDEYISSLQKKLDELKALKPKVVDNFDALQNELSETELAIQDIEINMTEYKRKLNDEEISIKSLINSLEIINADIQNNKDAARLQDLGSQLHFSFSSNICPVCNQTIHDILLPNNSDTQVMSIKDNIKHLEAQKDMLEFALKSHHENKNELSKYILDLKNRLYSLRKLAKSLRNDLFSTDDALSETHIIKKLGIETEINRLLELIKFIEEKKEEFKQLSAEWQEYLKDKNNLPSSRFSERDIVKFNTMREKFVENLKLYGYKSVLDFSKVEISLDTFLPAIEGFDMKFDSSASDNIRAIWSFTLALFQTSIEKGGTHPNIIIFDEPDQHSIVPSDMEKFFQSLVNFNGMCQVIVGLTLKDQDTRQAINNLPEGKYKLIQVPNKAFKKLDA